MGTEVAPSTGASDGSESFCRKFWTPPCAWPQRALEWTVELSTSRLGLRNPALRRRRQRCRHDHAEPAGHAQSAVERAARRAHRCLRIRTRRRRRPCVVLTSSHDRVFSSGANLGGFAGDVPLVHKHFGSDRFVKLFRLIGELGKPSLCAANGHVLAGSLGIALACDLIIAKEGAEFGTPEINVGAFPFMIMALIYRNVPRKRTNELLLLGDRISAQDAKEAGIVNKVVAR